MNPSDPWVALARHAPLAILTDLDGTLIPFAPRPEEARPGPAVLEVLASLASLPGTSVAIVSGRRRDQLDRMFTELPAVSLVAEHGAWRRGDGAWQAAQTPRATPPEGIAQVLEKLTAGVKRAFVERKSWSVCLNYREVSKREKAALVVAAQAAAGEWVRAHPEYEVLEAAEALEVRASAMKKSNALAWLRERAGVGARVLVLGDDVTDEDMFRAAGPGDESVIVGAAGGRSTAARWRLAGPNEAGAFLNWLVGARADRPTPTPAALPLLVSYRPRGKRLDVPLRLLVVSNRLPELRSPVSPEEVRKRSVGGLVSALEPVLSKRGGMWLGWSGQTSPADSPPVGGTAENGSPGLAWVELPPDAYELYYNGFCNRSLWPLFHTLPGRARFADAEWEAYRRVNAMYGAAAAELVSDASPVWAHDYHLYLLGAELRRLGHKGPIGHFLHVPFPSVDVFSMIPWAEQLLDGMLEFDLLGFHTRRFAENFLQAVGVLSPAAVGDDVVEHRGRRVRVGVFPIGIVTGKFQEAADTETAAEISALLQATAPAKLVLGVDRLDYTKGIPERLEAFGHFLAQHPEWKGRVSLVQVSVPSRADIPEYAEQRQRIENLVGRINGEHGEAHWVPVRYLYRSYPHTHLAQLYRAADVAMVTPLRDGMNLVAKEFVAAQDPARPGVLLLSRFAGAAEEMKDALLTNPWHTDGMARDLLRALEMPEAERLARHAKLAAAVARTTAASWAEDFLAALEACRSR
ncbi:MAG: trehalose 6-phosphate [Planctomycetota bacterium]|nr:MAG: trehalose 6-phosphate [Planctomycetota bacterium]